MEKGENVKGRLGLYWGRVGGRDKLAAATGITPGTLSGYNTGRLGLGPTNAKRIADALGVTVFDLGVSEAGGGEPEQTVLDRLRQLEVDLGESVLAQSQLVAQVKKLQAHVRRLEARQVPGRGAAGGHA